MRKQAIQKLCVICSTALQPVWSYGIVLRLIIKTHKHITNNDTGSDAI